MQVNIGRLTTRSNLPEMSKIKEISKKSSAKTCFCFFGASGLSKSSWACDLNSGVQILSFVGARSVELWPFYVFPESVSEGSFLNLGHHYLAIITWPFIIWPSLVWPSIFFYFFIVPPLFGLFRGIARVAWMQKRQWLIWFGEHLFSKWQFL